MYLLFSCSVVSDSFQLHGLQHASLPHPLLSLRVYSNWCPLSWWYCLTISFSATFFSSCLQSFPASGSFPMSLLFTSGGQSIRASASASVLPMNIQDWFPLGWTGLIASLSKGLSRVFSITPIQKHQSVSTQPSLWSDSHNCTWLLEKQDALGPHQSVVCVTGCTWHSLQSTFHITVTHLVFASVITTRHVGDHCCSPHLGEKYDAEIKYFSQGLHENPRRLGSWSLKPSQFCGSCSL